VDVDWLSTILKSLDPGHRFFAKDYLPQGEERRDWLTKVEEVFVDTTGFYSGLPKANLDPKANKKLRRHKMALDLEIQGGPQHKPETSSDVNYLRNKIDSYRKSNLRDRQRRAFKRKEAQEKMERLKKREKGTAQLYREMKANFSSDDGEASDLPSYSENESMAASNKSSGE